MNKEKDSHKLEFSALDVDDDQLNIKGELAIEWIKETETITWSWTPKDETVMYRCSRHLDRAAFQKLSMYYIEIWEQCNRDIRERRYDLARKKLEDLRNNIQVSLTPSEFSFECIPEDTAVIVHVEPHVIPIDIFEINGKPFCIRNMLLHKKLVDTRTTGVSNNKSSAPERQHYTPHGYIIIPGDCPHNDRQKHLESIQSHMWFLFGRDNVYHREDLVNEGKIDSNEILTALVRRDLGAFYYLGHGITGKNGGLKLDKDNLDAVSLQNWLYKHAPVGGGLAFLNACWTASHKGNGLDIVKAFCKHGWQAVIGTVGAPLGSQAAHFANDFFSTLRKNINILHAFHESQSNAWNRFKNEDLPDMAWAFYRLYASEGPLSLRTRLTWNNTMLNPWNGSPIEGIQIDQTMGRSIACLLNQFTLSKEPSEFIKCVFNMKDQRQLLYSILRSAIVSPNGDFAENIFDDNSRGILKAAIGNTLMRKGDELSKEDIENAILFAGGEDYDHALHSQSLAISDRVMETFICALQDVPESPRITIDDIEKGFSVELNRPAYFLFETKGREINWTALSGSARCIIIEASKIARKSHRKNC